MQNLQLVQELSGEHPLRVPCFLQSAQFRHLAFASEAKFDGISSRSVLEISVLGSVRAPGYGNALSIQLRDSLVACRICVPYDVVPAFSEYVINIYCSKRSLYLEGTYCHNLMS